MCPIFSRSKENDTKQKIKSAKSYIIANKRSLPRNPGKEKKEVVEKCETY